MATSVAAACLSAAAPALASWNVPAGVTGSAMAVGGAAPSAPGGVTASCPGALSTVKISWNAVTHASTYTVLDSLNSGPYVTLTSGVAATSYTASGLLTGSYTFEVEAVAGSSWQSSNSAATASRSISITGACS